MLTTQQREQHQEDVEAHKREALSALIEEQVMHILGTPGNLLEVQVRPLWTNHYRVNVFVGLNAAAASVANSYFLVIGSDGIIITSVPTITRQY